MTSFFWPFGAKFLHFVQQFSNMAAEYQFYVSEDTF